MSWRRIGILVLVLVPLACAVILLADPLNRMLVRLELSQIANPGWQSGFWTPIDLPKAASDSNLVDRLAGADLYEVIRSRRVSTWGKARSSEFVTALVKTPGGLRICVFRYIPWTDSWEARIYEP